MPAAAQCPINHEHLSTRMIARSRATGAVPLEKISEQRWQVRGYAIAKSLLRGQQTRQAGFSAEQFEEMPKTILKNAPVLFQDGPTHIQQRTELARFFTPRTASANYQQMMETYADELIAQVQRSPSLDLSTLTMKMACAVAAQIVGLTDSLLPGMHKRIETFVADSPAYEPDEERQSSHFFKELAVQINLLKFYLLDVWPAIRKRKKQPQEDVISHLLEKGYSGPEITVECLTYGTAGMATTREFISAAAWHLFQNDTLRQQYINSADAERYQILEEILRVEPIVATLLRRASEDIELEVDGEMVTIQAGDVIEFDIPAINSDASIVGEEGDCIIALRELNQRVQPPVMAFGDGHHRCPGAYIAIQESDIFLRRLMSIESLRLVSEPAVGYVPSIKGYAISNFRVSVQ